MSIPVEPIKIPNPSRTSGQALSPKTRPGWGPLIPFDPEYSAGAFNAVNVCLRLQASEQVCVITDKATIEIAASMVREIENVGAPYHAWVLEELVERPLKDLPREILDDLETSQVSIFAVQVQRQELRSRIQMTEKNPACAHGEHQSADHAGGDAGGFWARGQAQPEDCRDGEKSFDNPCEDRGGNGSDGGVESELQVAEDQRNH